MGILISAMIMASGDSEKLQEVYYNGVREGKRIAAETTEIKSDEKNNV